MIGKCKAIAHGGTALGYIFRDGKLGQYLVSNNLYGTTPKEIYEEMKMVSDYNTRCRNKFLRIEIGIVPKDEKRLSLESVRNLASNFARHMGLENHQWVAVMHKDTDNMHIRIIANRISLYGEVYDNTFVSNRAARLAEELSRKYGMTIAKEVKAERRHQKEKANPTREQTKKEMRQICYALLDKYRGTGITGHSMLLYELNKNGITIERMKNKQGKVYGLKFSYAGQSFKASEIGREFGYRSLQKNFEPTEKKEQHTAGYQLVPPSRSSISRDNDTPRVQNPIGAVADTIVGAADEMVEGLGDLITPTIKGDDYAETAWQRKLRSQANRKKKRGRGI